MRRFWQTATATPCNSGWQVRLDGRPVRLPGGAPLLVASRALAVAIAAEWQLAGDAAGGTMSYDDVQLTRLAGTAQERIAPDPVPVMEELARYGQTDLLCYRASHPDALVRRQETSWQPWLDWAEQTLGARLRITEGVMPVAQDSVALAVLAEAVAAYDPLALAALGVAVPALGSLVLGLALAAGRLDAATAHGLSSLDEIFQEELWGRDPATAERRRIQGGEIALAGRFLELTRLADGTP
jgi:chaperone required for assembly of F1-ATPase